jgi:small GTP-binding protein
MVNTITFLGKTGVGKSATINKLFGTKLETNNVVSCTKDAFYYQDDNGVTVIDLPGIAESISADEKYKAIYEKVLSVSNHVVWVLQADTRIYRADQVFMKENKHLLKDKKVTFCLNRVDEISGNWLCEENVPSISQKKIIEELTIDIKNKFSNIIEEFEIVAFSAIKGFNKELLLEKIGVK